MKRQIKSSVKKVADKVLLPSLRYLKHRGQLSNHKVQMACHNRAIADSADYAETNMPAALMFAHRVPLWDYAWSHVTLKGLIVEFGVFKGASINHFAKKTPAMLYGFDSFEGLQEDWRGHNLPKGFFNLGGQLPKVEKNVTLIKGWFDQTVPPFLANHHEPLAFLHIDSDTYEAAKYLLTILESRLMKGTVILFDEYFGYRGWRIGEWQAWQEFIARTGVKYRYLGFADEQVAVVLE